MHLLEKEKSIEVQTEGLKIARELLEGPSASWAHFEPAGDPLVQRLRVVAATTSSIDLKAQAEALIDALRRQMLSSIKREIVNEIDILSWPPEELLSGRVGLLRARIMNERRWNEAVDRIRGCFGEFPEQEEAAREIDEWRTKQSKLLDDLLGTAGVPGTLPANELRETGRTDPALQRLLRPGRQTGGS
jgi:hypothetical protein